MHLRSRAHSSPITAFLWLLCITITGAATVEEALKLPDQWKDKVLNERLLPHWLPDGDSFWYQRQATGGKAEFVLIQAGSGARKTAATREALDLPPPATRRTSQDGVWTTGFSPKDTLPVKVTLVNAWKNDIELFWLDHYGKRKTQGMLKVGAKFTKTTAKDARWWFEDVKTKSTVALMIMNEDGEEIIIDGKPAAASALRLPGLSPDKQWYVTFKDSRVSLGNAKTKKVVEIKCTLPAGAAFMGRVSWSPDSRSFIVPAVLDVERPKLTLVEALPKDSAQPKVKTLDYFRAGDALPKAVPVLFHVGSSEGIVVKDDLFPNPYATKSTLDVQWAPDSSEFYFNYDQRGHQLFRSIAVSATSGTARTVLEETSTTFIDYGFKGYLHRLLASREILWLSERDGWAHLWLYDVSAGRVKNQVTKGAWLVRKVLHLDEATRQVWFMAGGLHPAEDPCQQHLCRVNLDGSGFVQLTQGDGDHRVQFSPKRTWFIDTWSRADATPVIELRRSSDGSKICDLEKADATALLATVWQMPERFVAKGRDGTTDIHGVIYKPSHLDPTRKYPVLEQVYAGPPGTWAPKSFGLQTSQHQLAALGFVVVQADGMGTNHRSKAFHDVCFKNFKDAGFPDRIAWIKAAAKTRPWMDLSRVGIYGGSAGGHNAMRALLDHHDFYHAAFSDSGCHDNRMNMMAWNESFMGWPVGEQYAQSSNVLDAHKLKGHLFLTMGELDSNVDPASTLQVVSALQKAGKTFDFMPIMAGEHCAAATTDYGRRLRMDFFLKHLYSSPQ
ncbi:prolyl oligopeptidase family serine peptidase [Prosthecobacter sp.]|uniref:prolyl oligopeptidase family serine peptidase n=1 Tax=Prosthecobacter sp. TaxID=1965333 RepID=UPI0037846C4D